MQKVLMIHTDNASVTLRWRYSSAVIALAESAEDHRLFKTTRISARVVGSANLKNDVSTTLELVVCDRPLFAVPVGAFADRPNGFDVPLIIDAHDTVEARIGLDRRVEDATDIVVTLDYESISP